MKNPLAAAAGAILLLILLTGNLHAQSGNGATQLVTREDLAGKKWTFLSKALTNKTFTAVWTFNADKSLTLGSGPMSKWSIRGKTLRVDHADKDGRKNWQVFSLEVQPSKDGALVIKEVDSAAGKRDNITLTQLK